MAHADTGKRLGLSMQVLIGQEVEGQILFFIFFGEGKRSQIPIVEKPVSTF